MNLYGRSEAEHRHVLRGCHRRAVRESDGAPGGRRLPDVHPRARSAFRHGRLTMDELLKENKRIEVDLTGLKT